MDIETLAGIVKERFDDLQKQIDTRFDAMEIEIRHLREDVRDIKHRLSLAEDDIKNVRGYAKEIDNILDRLRVLEQQVAAANSGILGV